MPWSRRPTQRAETRLKYADPAPIWWRWLRRFLTGVGLVVVVIVLSIFAMRGGEKAVLPNSVILTMHFTGKLAEHPDRMSFWSAPDDDFYQVITALRAGAKDTRVRALVGIIWNGDYSIAQIREIRAALDEWRAAGKKTYAFSTSYGDGATGMAGYWLASAFDQIWLQPAGVLSINGLRLEAPYMRGLLDRNGIVPEFFAFSTYKTLFDTVARSDMSAADHTQLKAVLNGFTDSFVSDVATAREMAEADVRMAIRNAPYTTETALKAKLIDRVGYDDELGARLRLELRDDKLPFVEMAAYMPHIKTPVTKGTRTVALINIEDAITDAMTMPEEAQSVGGPLSAPDYCVSCALMVAGDDPKISGILLRVNSPGGSPSASESIRRAVIVARAKGKPVVVSMGDIAASGGYWVASAADKIVAQPTTLTGSIGVTGGKFSAQKLLNDYGVRFDGVAADDAAPNMASMVTPYTPEAAARVRGLMASSYEQFKRIVAEGRGIKDVESIAQGRVWIGTDAKRVGLVDELGGLEQAKNLLSVALKGEIVVQPYMRQTSPLAGLRGMINIPFISSFLKEWRAVSASVNRPVVEARERLSAF